MPATSRIATLARLAGIAPSYEDAWGKRRRLSRERIEALLAALGLPTGDDRDLAAAIDRLKNGPWRRSVPPVVIIREGGTIQVPIVTPRPSGDASLEWRVMDERGEEYGASVSVADLDRLATRRVDGRLLDLRALALPERLPTGRHTLHVVSTQPDAVADGTARLFVVPQRCYLPPALESGRRVWGFAIQLYALRSSRNWGVGDFTDLERFVEAAHELGAALVGVNPLHALFPANPQRASPYAPSSRMFLNVLYIDIERVDDYAECAPARDRVTSPEFQARLAALRDAPLVEYGGVAAGKLEILELLYRSFRERHLGMSDGPNLSERGRMFRRFQDEAGRSLRSFATFEALSEHFGSADNGREGWTAWPEPFRDPASAAVATFARERADRIEYFEYRQWLADGQLRAVASRCEQLGLPVGLYLDLAIGVARDGADVWADRECYQADATVGAPPDIWNPLGQDWGLQPMHPEIMRDRGYTPVASMLRANMRGAGALRIDHALALMHLYWIPRGRTAAEGGYVRYLLDDLVGLIALESQRHRCVVIGEDLGTVPEPFRRRLREAGILSYRLLYFEKDAEGRFLPPEAYPKFALASVTTHDLPTLPGYWAAHDLAQRARLGLFPSQEHERRAFEDRGQDRHALLQALAAEGLWSGDPTDPPPERDRGLVDAVHAFLARSPCAILVVQLEDVLGLVEQANLPGTRDEHPNWRRKLPADLSEIVADERVVSLARLLGQIRGVTATAP